MATASQPISIASASNSQSHHNVWSSPSTSGSITSSMGIHPAPIFNAGSFSSGSVLSAASFGSKLFSNSPSQFIHPLEYVCNLPFLLFPLYSTYGSFFSPNVYRCRISSSLESDRASKILAMNHEIANKEEELVSHRLLFNFDASLSPFFHSSPFHSMPSHSFIIPSFILSFFPTLLCLSPFHSGLVCSSCSHGSPLALSSLAPHSSAPPCLIDACPQLEAPRVPKSWAFLVRARGALPPIMPCVVESAGADGIASGRPS